MVKAGDDVTGININPVTCGADAQSAACNSCSQKLTELSANSFYQRSGNNIKKLANWGIQQQQALCTAASAMGPAVVSASSALVTTAALNGVAEQVSYDLARLMGKIKEFANLCASTSRATKNSCAGAGSSARAAVTALDDAAKFCDKIAKAAQIQADTHVAAAAATGSNLAGAGALLSGLGSILPMFTQGSTGLSSDTSGLGLSPSPSPNYDSGNLFSQLPSPSPSSLGNSGGSLSQSTLPSSTPSAVYDGGSSGLSASGSGGNSVGSLGSGIADSGSAAGATLGSNSGGLGSSGSGSSGFGSSGFGSTGSGSGSAAGLGGGLGTAATTAGLGGGGSGAAGGASYGPAGAGGGSGGGFGGGGSSGSGSNGAGLDASALAKAPGIGGFDATGGSAAAGGGAGASGSGVDGLGLMPDGKLLDAMLGKNKDPLAAGAQGDPLAEGAAGAGASDGRNPASDGSEAGPDGKKQIAVNMSIFKVVGDKIRYYKNVKNLLL